MTERREICGSVRELISAALSTVVIFGVLIGTATLSPESEPTFTESFGPRPFGFPVMNVVFVAFAVAYLPLIPATCALTRMVSIRQEQTAATKFEDWERVNALTAEARASLRIALWGLAYFVAISGAWIVYAETNGLSR